MPPEQAPGRDVDARTDVFSLGAVLFEIGTGQRAFSGKTRAAVFDAILNRAPADPPLRRSNTPLSWTPMIRRSGPHAGNRSKWSLVKHNNLYLAKTHIAHRVAFILASLNVFISVLYLA